MAAVTALTAQNTVGVEGVHGVPAEFLERQIAVLVDDCPPLATKTGMLFSAAAAHVVARWAERGALGVLVVDPVMVATSGDALVEPDAVAAIRSHLLPCAAVITPNLPEAGVLLGRAVTDADHARAAAEDLAREYGAVAVVKGGDAAGTGPIQDVVAHPGEAAASRTHVRVPLPATHGTGCTLSAAIAACLARGLDEACAIDLATDFVVAGLQSAFAVGHGARPVNHFAASGVDGAA